MSRLYEMKVELPRINPLKEDAILGECCSEWYFQRADFYVDPSARPNRLLTCTAPGFMRVGESEDEFVKRLTNAIWKANGAYCRVIIQTTYLESVPPNETHELGVEDYKMFKEGQEADDE